MHLWLLFTAWALFSVTVILTIASYMYSQWTIPKDRQIAVRFFLEGDANAYAEAEVQERRMRRIGLTAGTCFILAMLCLTAYVAVNYHRESVMANKGTPPSDVIRRGLPNAPPLDQFRPTPAAPPAATTPAPAQPTAPTSDAPPPSPND